MKKTTSIVLLTTMSLIMTGCSASNLTQPINNVSSISAKTSFLTKKEMDSFNKEYSAFKTKALSQDYLDRKVRKLLISDLTGEQLEREIEYARVIHPQLLIDIMHADQTLYNQNTGVTGKARVSSRYSSDPVFRAYVDQFSLSSNQPVNNWLLTTIAGGKNINGDGGIASNYSRFEQMDDLETDSQGNIYIAETSSGRIRKIDHSTGVITTIAGNGEQGYLGDGGQATASQLNRPEDIALDSQGNIYIADMYNGRVRKIDKASGIITTIAGDGSESYGGDEGLAINSQLNQPQGVALDSQDNIYIVDSTNNRIRKIDHSTGIITTVAGNGSPSYGGDDDLAVNASLFLPQRIQIDSDNNIYFSDSYNNRVRKVDQTTGIITTIAGDGTQGDLGDGGLAINSELHNPYGLKIDSAGNIYISDAFNYKIRKIDKTTGIINTIIGNGTQGNEGDGGLALNSQISVAYSMAFDPQGNIIIPDDKRIRKIDKNSGIINSIAGIGLDNNIQATTAALIAPEKITTDSQGNIYFCEFGNNTIRKVDHSTGIITTIAGDGTFGFNGDNIQATSAKLSTPIGLELDSDDNLYFADTGSNRVRKIDHATGVITTIAGTGQAGFNGDNILATNAQLSNPSDVKLDSDGNIYITDVANQRVRKIDKTSGIITTIAGTGMSNASFNDNVQATDANLKIPYSLDFDSQGNLYLADNGDQRVRKIDKPSGIITTIAGNGLSGNDGEGGQATDASFNTLIDVKLDSYDNVYISDTSGFKVRKIDKSTGIITTIAGTGNFSFNANSGNSTSIDITPYGLAFDSNDNLYITDIGNNIIRKLVSQ